MQSLIYYCLLPTLAGAEMSVLSQLFRLASSGAQSNVKLSWSLVDGATNYTVLAGTDLAPVASSPGNGVDLYDLTGAETYQVRAFNGSDPTPLDASANFTVTPVAAAAGALDSYDNLVRSDLRVQSKIKIGSTFYRYNLVTDAQGYSHFSEQSSTDGYTFTGDTQVLPRATVCASVANGQCKLESIKWAQHPDTEEAVMWAHFENAADYTLGQVAGASGLPGSGGNFSFSGAFRPAGDDSRDLTFFADTDGAGYIISAINTNTDLGLYALTADWRNVSGKTATLQAGERREAPAMVHVDGSYYLFTSTANGWYPSEGKYISAPALAGPWTASRNIGNAGNFGAQSGQIEKIGPSYLQASNRWAAQWAVPEASNRQVLLPIAFSGGVAQYNFYPTLQYNDEQGVVVPVQSGRIVSVGRTVTASAGTNAAAAADGIQSDPDNLYVPAAVPFEWAVDLAGEHAITQVDMTPKSVGGSDTYLQYTVQGSVDGTTWTTIADESTNQAVGFRTNQINDTATYRHVKLAVQRVVNIRTSSYLACLALWMHLQLANFVHRQWQ